MMKFFLSALPLVAAEVTVLEELSAPAVEVRVPAEHRRLIGPEWTWPVKPWKLNAGGCPYFEPQFDGMMGENNQRGLTCNYDKVCCPGGECVAHKQAKCTMMLPSGCKWETKLYGTTMWKRGQCLIVHVGKHPVWNPTPPPTTPPQEPVHYFTIGSGKCVTKSGGDPPFKYFSAIGSSECKDRCSQRSDCGGYSVSDSNNCLIWLWPSSNLNGNGPAWGGASCHLKKATNPNPVYVYHSLGFGECKGQWGETIPYKYYGGIGEAQCKAKCDERTDCGGYSASDFNNCMIWLSSQVTGGGSSWGGSSCMKKTEIYRY